MLSVSVSLGQAKQSSRRLLRESPNRARDQHGGACWRCAHRMPSGCGRTCSENREAGPASGFKERCCGRLASLLCRLCDAHLGSLFGSTRSLHQHLFSTVAALGAPRAEHPREVEHCCRLDTDAPFLMWFAGLIVSRQCPRTARLALIARTGELGSPAIVQEGSQPVMDDLEWHVVSPSQVSANEGAHEEILAAPMPGSIWLGCIVNA